MFHVWDVVGLRRRYDPVSPSERPLISEPPPPDSIAPLRSRSDPPPRPLDRYRQLQQSGPTSARHIMSRPVSTVRPEASLLHAVHLLRQRKFRHAPVISGEFLVGILSERDLLRHLATVDDPSSLATTAVRAHMRQDVLSAHPMTPLREVAQVMLQERVGALPIMDETPQLVGIVTRSDILRWVVLHAPVQTWA